MVFHSSPYLRLALMTLSPFNFNVLEASTRLAIPAVQYEPWIIYHNCATINQSQPSTPQTNMYKINCPRPPFFIAFPLVARSGVGASTIRELGEANPKNVSTKRSNKSCVSSFDGPTRRWLLSGGGDHHQRPEMVRFCWLKSQSFLGEREKNDSGLYLMV